MADKCCSTCAWWRYDRWTEEKYGMGVGVCKADNKPTFCGKRNCPFHSDEEG